jgi:hypothetical protein
MPPTPAPPGDTFGGEADASAASAGGGSDDIEPRWGAGRSPEPCVGMGIDFWISCGSGVG